MSEKVSKEIAVQEVMDFVEYHLDIVKKDYEIESDYPQIVKAIEDGRLSFNEKKIPTLVLKEPILNAEGQVSLDTITFRTRIKPTQLAEVMKGVDLQKNQLEYSLRALSYLTGQVRAMLDNFGKIDYKTIDQIATVFL